MIELQNIEKSFDRGRSFVVSDVSLSVERGQLLCLIGESGSGKTTTLKMINRIQEPSSGTIIVNNENILHQDPVNLRRSIGYVFQGIGLFPHYTVLDNVAAVPSLLRWERPLIDSRCEEILEMVLNMRNNEVEETKVAVLDKTHQKMKKLISVTVGKYKFKLEDNKTRAININ